MSKTAFQILNVTRDADFSKLAHDPEDYYENLAVSVLSSETSRFYYEQAQKLSFDMLEVPVLSSDNQLTWEKDAPHEFKFWTQAMPNRPLRLEYANIKIVETPSYGVCKTLYMTFKVSLQLQHKTQNSDKKSESTFSEALSASKTVNLQLPYTHIEMKQNLPQTDERIVEQLAPQLLFMQNSTFRSKETGEKIEIPLEPFREEIAMKLACEATQFEQSLGQMYHIHEVEAFDRSAEYTMESCELLYNNIIVQVYKLDKTPRVLAMNLVNGNIVGKSGESKVKAVFSGLFKKKE